MSDKSKKQPVVDLSELVDLDGLPDLAGDDSVATVIDLVGALDEPAPLDTAMDGDRKDETVGVIDSDVDFDAAYGDDEWTDSAANPEADSLPLAAMDDIVVDLENADDGEFSGDDETFLAGLVDDVEDAVFDWEDDAEGPLASPNEVFDLEIVPLDEPMEDEELDEDVYDTLNRLNLSLELDETSVAETAQDSVEPSTFKTLEPSYLGPTAGDVSAILFHDGAPIGVGDGIYVVGADQMFHRGVAVGYKHMVATSVAAKDDVLFVGTVSQGVLKSTDRGRTFSSCNSWFTEGLDGEDSVKAVSCSTRFNLFGRIGATEFTLFGWTGEGQLYLSDDEGASWRGPLLKGWRCEGVCADGAGERVLIMATRHDGVKTLLKTVDLVSFSPLALPSSVAAALGSGTVVFDAAPGILAVSSGRQSEPLYLSLDGGGSWHAQEGILGVSAVVVDQCRPEWLAVSRWDPRGGSIICITENRGKTWRDACEIVDEDRAKAPLKIVGLCLDDAPSRSLLALRADGVYLIHLEEKSLSH